MIIKQWDFLEKECVLRKSITFYINKAVMSKLEQLFSPMLKTLKVWAATQNTINNSHSLLEGFVPSLGYRFPPHGHV